MVTWKLVGWLRMALMSILALAPLAQYRGAGAAPDAFPELAIDVDGDGRADRVRWARYDDAWWLDVAIAGATEGELEVRSTTRVAAASAGDRWSLSAADVDGDGKLDVLVRDAAGHTTAWLSDGLAFTSGGSTSLFFSGLENLAGLVAFEGSISPPQDVVEERALLDLDARTGF
jgi:hypothetical protein